MNCGGDELLLLGELVFPTLLALAGRANEEGVAIMKDPGYQLDSTRHIPGQAYERSTILGEAALSQSITWMRY
jgi:hypothetical protein